MKHTITTCLSFRSANECVLSSIPLRSFHSGAASPILSSAGDSSCAMAVETQQKMPLRSSGSRVLLQNSSIQSPCACHRLHSGVAPVADKEAAKNWQSHFRKPENHSSRHGFRIFNPKPAHHAIHSLLGLFWRNRRRCKPSLTFASSRILLDRPPKINPRFRSRYLPESRLESTSKFY